MRRSKLLVVALAASMALSSATAQAGGAPPVAGNTGATTPAWFWAVFGCAGGIVFTAMVANWQQNRQLTAAEAATCGILFWITPPKPR